MRTGLMPAAVLAVATLTLSACGGNTSRSSGTAAHSSTSKPIAASTEPVGLVAIGHSALTGENSDPDNPGKPAFQNSWATGGNPAVDSIYLRMIGQWPETQGHVANTARGGATADVLAKEADSALTQVPAPRLVIIETIDNDITCDGQDAGHVRPFGASVDSALRLISQRSPKSRILLITQPGRPVTDIAAIAAMPPGSAKAALVQGLTGPAPCGAYDDKGQLQPENVASLTAIIEAYEGEQARVCAQYPPCSPDQGALHSYVNRPEYLSSDTNHRNVAGLAALAAAVWPSVQAALA